MGTLLQIFTYITFGLVLLTGMLMYFKDHKLYPSYPIYFRISVSLMIIVVSLQIFLLFPSIMGFLLWLFFISIVVTNYFLIKMIGAKNLPTSNKYKRMAIFCGMGTFIILLILGYVAFSTAQQKNTFDLSEINSKLLI